MKHNNRYYRYSLCLVLISGFFLTAWVGRNDQGEIYRFSLDYNQTKAHFSGIVGVGDGARNVNMEYVLLRFSEMDNK